MRVGRNANNFFAVSPWGFIIKQIKTSSELLIEKAARCDTARSRVMRSKYARPTQFLSEQKQGLAFSSIIIIKEVNDSCGKKLWAGKRGVG
jgi:hypothetical protein